VRRLILDTLVVGALQTNCYILGCPNTREALVIDPGAEAELIGSTLDKHGLKLKTVVLTHGHADHIGACGELRREPGVTLAIHREDAPLLSDTHRNLTAYIGPPLTLSAAETLLGDGDRVEFGAGIQLTVLHTPGHTRGSICLLGEGFLFSGDTLFAGAVGRTDFPGGDFKTLIASLKNRLEPLPDDTRVYPGHGPASTMGVEKRENPYLTTEW